jgi:hypothetical protein
LLEPGLDLAQIQAVIVPQIENAHESQLVAGDLAQRLRLDADPLAMSKIEKPLFEQWREAISSDRGLPSEKIFEHDPVSSLKEPEPCHRMRIRKLCCGD